jgi:hypothetical protein
MAQTGFTPISIYYSSTATNVPTAGNLVAGELAINTADGKLFYKDSSGVVQTIASKAGALGDVVGPASATDNALVRFDATTGKLIQNSVGILSDAGALTGITDFTYTGTLTGGTGIVNLGSGQVYKDASGNVGIGTASPTRKLQVSQSNATAYTGDFDDTPNQFYLVNTNTTTNAYTGIQMDVGGNSQASISAVRTADGAVATTFCSRISGTRAERMRIDSSGNVGIGTSSPNAPLQIQANSSGISVRVSGRASDGYADMSLYNNANTVNNAFFGSSNSATFLGTGTTIPLTFQTDNTERMRIDSSGRVQIGTTAPISSGFTTISYAGGSLNGLIISESAGTSGTAFLGFNSGATNIGSVSRVGTTNAVVYSTTSDQRLKSNIADANPVLDKLMTVKVRQFDWTEGDLHQDAGFIAQELAPILSGIVIEGKTEEDMWQMDYSRLTPYLVKAIQEQQSIITNLTTRLTALENK